MRMHRCGRSVAVRTDPNRMGRPEGAIVVRQARDGRTGAGRGVRLALAALLVAVMLPVAAPSAMGAADDDFPGVPIPASPITGTLDDTLDHGDLFAVDLQAGQSITVALKGPDTADFDLYLYPPGTTIWESAIDVAYSWSMSSVELLTWVAETPGTRGAVPRRARGRCRARRLRHADTAHTAGVARTSSE